FPSLRPRLSELMAHAEPSVREAAILACDALLAPTGTSPPPLDDSLLTRLAERVADPSPEVRRTALELLADVAPPGYAPAAAPVRELARSADAAIARPALRVLGRVGDLASVETMIEVAQGSQLALAREAIRLLEQLQGPVKVERTAEGGFVPVLALSCGCGERPVWRTDALGREMLVCPGCRTSFLLTASGALAPVTALPYGICRCCRRPAPLEQSEGGLRCPTTGDVHLRHPASGATYRASSLPHGGCGCCAPPVPLFEAAGRVYCPQSGRAHQPTPQLGYAPVPAPGQEGRPAGPAATHPTVAEVNRALLEGSLMLTQSGLPVIGDGEE
ncbi:MAG: hypothetical protein FJ125_06080, partial [Deltaproteobacteria bacterium]|nr:hypothetical protein [Deltaproteobacteria bacterium]